MPFLDEIGQAEDLPGHYRQVMDSFLHEREERHHFDWRYYLVKYASMRSGHSGLYMSETEEPGYRMVMLHKTRMNSNYRDPYLYQIWLSWRETSPAADHLRVQDPWFTGYEHHPRWLNLMNSGVGLRCVTEGFSLRPPSDPSLREVFETVCASSSFVEADEGRLLLRIPQQESPEGPVDTLNRIETAHEFLDRLIAAGL